MKTIHVPQAVIIDFDRTLGDVDCAVERLHKAADEFNIDVANIKAARLAAENDGGSFDPLQFIQKQLSDKDFEQYLNVYQSLAEPQIMYPDAKAFLKKIDSEEIYYIVLTYGTNPGWQILKARSAGYKGPIAVVSHTQKGAAISEHRQNDGTYHFVDETNQITFIAQTVCLIDDKAIAFSGLPEDCNGYLMQRSNSLLKSQLGNIPTNVSVIKCFDDLTIKTGIVTASANKKHADTL